MAETIKKGDVYANGQKVATAKLWCKFFFGEFFERVEVDCAKRRFNIFVKEKILDENNEVVLIESVFDLEEFKDYWQPEFLLIKTKYQI